jgi:hypothetical protein
LHLELFLLIRYILYIYYYYYYYVVNCWMRSSL